LTLELRSEIAEVISDLNPVKAWRIIIISDERLVVGVGGTTVGAAG
jgi:hypothetical protein